MPLNDHVAPLPRLAVDGLTWPESPRWRDGALWFSDVHNFRVMRVVPGEEAKAVAHLPGRPGGLGFMPDGRLLAATALDRKLWWILPGSEPELAADLSTAVKGLLNDMVVDQSGRAWVGDTGFDLLKGEPEVSGRLLAWTEGGGCQVAAEDVRFPNGIAISSDRCTLYLAETFGRCVSAYAMSADGSLSERRVHAQLSGRPDGMCLDAEGCLWVALLWDNEFQRISPDGRVIARIPIGKERAVSCVLGGDDRHQLFMGVSEVDESDKAKILRTGSIRHLRVGAAGHGVP
ncbi:SMP-30/gluconolactonase/LRE family protein [Variovorax sp. dw_954]|uniref:SMP-30/gluconolactonase/LRE family protein n=1 Tax=Variovorax sp. dw_954 TaxID=2720078 RepID=UPI001BD1FD27|nr:SMP-30/gluconolactonase/LRE family protein [Variovorax sp. dw_954]